MADTGAAIELVDLTKHYPGNPRPSVDGVTLRVHAGETVVFVGPSGCGKSTTLKMINRLIEPSSGSVRINGADVTGLDPVKLRREIGYAIQSSGLFPHMTVAQNIALVPRLAGWSGRRVRARVTEMLELVGLDPGEFSDRYPHRLSGGQQQRVGVARALAADPPVLLMDEPFGAVDPITRGHLQDELLRLQRELRKTIVFVTHDVDEAIKLGDRIAVLGERSRIAQFDTPEAILAHPADDFVSGFVGTGAALRRLDLTRLRDVGVTGCPTAHQGEPVQQVRGRLRASATDEMLLLDRRGRPIRWLRREDLTHPEGPLAEAGAPVDGTVTRDATLREALEAVLTDSAGRAAVTGRNGVYAGAVHLEGLLDAVRGLLAADRRDAREHQRELEATRTGPTLREPEGVTAGKAVGGRAESGKSGTAGRPEGEAAERADADAAGRPQAVATGRPTGEVTEGPAGGEATELPEADTPEEPEGDAVGSAG
ncbi:ABC transporter ATP-binding protein [Streptomyces sp. MA5143a]|uniref:ABC transporter ATP-binding protein n=1 Tax=Streptomyces sp. MA5143a TaxID=2083010 RepID=UPI000D1B1B46|nr:ATP-binding cassette domain-containing protein [Streptomyces sp. MA5143a]SPF03202.1 Glycine betaine/carnitine/choline transport ATP-binding protein OpuCA [Streptomyces sp. MA5143a]